MEKRPRIYIETTLPNYVFNDDLPEKQMVAQQLFSQISQGKFTPYISTVTTEEITKTPEPKRSQMLELIQGFIILEPDAASNQLAEAYLQHHIIPPVFQADALHIALATVYTLDAIVSYNFRHIVNLKTIKGVTGINLLFGYQTPDIVPPEEVIIYDR